MLVHSFTVLVMMYPLPLQLFAPLQALVAVLQSLCPLHELTPIHFTEAGDPLVSAKTVVANKVPTAAASSIPSCFLFIVKAFWKLSYK